MLISSDTHSTPLFNLSIVVPTLAHDHSGLPHTLEHLIFLGSKLYPQKGFLDRLATMGAANGTNAYTSEDHTCYTLSTASPEGLLTITPVFLDHVLRPLLGEDEFISEVWDGNDKGVVYSEMRGREWNEGDQQAGLLGQLLAEHNNIFDPYKWECGGRTPVIRELDMQSIREYHAYWYNTRNVILQLSGPIGQELCTKLLQHISTLLDTFSEAEQSPCLPKSLTTDKMLHSIQTRGARFMEALFPAEDESQCSVALAWDLTSYSEKDLVALGILSKYLKDTSGSPLNHHFTQDPDNIICSTVDIDIKWWLGAALFMSFSGVDNSEEEPSWNKPHAIAQELKKVLQELACTLGSSQTSKETFRGEVRVALRNHTLNTLERAEDDPHELAFSYLLPELLKASHLGMEFTGRYWTESAVILQELDRAEADFWFELLKRFGGMEPVGEVLLKPSQSLSDQLKASKSEIGDVVEQQQPSSTDAIRVPTIKVTSQLVVDAIEHRNLKVQDTTKCTQLVNIKSSFNHITIGINIESIILEYPELLPYLVLFQELFVELDVDVKPVPRFETSILENRVYTYKEMQSLLHQSFSSASSGVGFDSGSSSPFVIGFQETCLIATATCKAEISPEAAINLLLNILLNSIYSEDRIDVILEQLKESLVDGQRDPGVISDSILMQLICRNGTNGSKRAKCPNKLAVFEACGLFKQHQFLKSLDTGDAIDKLKRIQDLLCKIITESNEKEWNMFFQIGSSDQIPKFSDVQGTAFPSEGVRRLALNFVHETTAIVLPIRDLTASHLHLTVACPEILKHPSDDVCLVEFLACSVLCHLMSMLEGPLYRAIRGAGLAYHADVSLSVWSGLLGFNVYQASDIAACYRVLSTMLSNPTSWLTTQNIDLAKKALIFQFVNERATTSDILASLLRDTLRGLPIETGGEYFRLLEKVDMDSVSKVATTFFTRLIDANVPRVAIVQHGNAGEGSVKKIIDDFARAGFVGFESKCLQRDYLKPSGW